MTWTPARKTETNPPVKPKVSAGTIAIIVVICLLPFGLPALLIYLFIRWIVQSTAREYRKGRGVVLPNPAPPATQGTQRDKGFWSYFLHFR